MILVKIILIGILANCPIFAFETKVPYRDCGSPLATLTRLEVIPCEKDVCVLTRGENATLIVELFTRIKSEILYINVYQQDWVFSLDTVLWHKHNVCGKYGMQCPSEPYRTQHGLFHVTLPKSLPALKLWLKVALHGDDDRQLLCKSVPLDIR